MPRLIVPPFAYHSGQRALLEGRRRFNTAAMGRRWGKTMFGLEQLLFEEGGATYGHPVAWFAPTYKLLLEVSEHCERTLGPILKTSNKTEGRMTLRTGGSVDFWTLEDSDAGRGRKYKRAVIDEAAHAKLLKDAWERSIMATLADLRGDAWFLSSTKGFNFFHELYSRGDPGNPARDPDWASFRMPTWTNPHIHPDEIELARRTLPSLVFRQEYGAEFVVIGAGLMRPEYMRQSEPGIARRALAEGWKIGVGVDLAISTKTTADPSAIVVKAIEPDTGRRHTIEVRRGRWTMQETLQQIREVHDAWHPGAIVIEAVQYQAAVTQELLRTSNLPVFGEHPSRDKVTRFMPLLAQYEHGNEYHAPDLPSYFADELLAFPQGEHDDLVDAAVYAGIALERCTPQIAVMRGGKRL